MNKTIINIAILGLTSTLLAGNAYAQSCTDMMALEHFIGFWQEKTNDQITTENWQKVSEKSFEGIGVTYDSSMEIKSLETLRIVEMSGEIFYLAKVKQNKFPTAFRLMSCDENIFKFENKLHDFPKMITYTFIGAQQLHVDVRGDNGEGFEIEFMKSSMLDD